MPARNKPVSELKAALLCASHSPLNYCFARKPARWDEIEQVYRERRAALRKFDPELVIAFGSDHFNGFFMKLMPAFCVGAAAQAAADIGGFEGPLTVPRDTALQCVQALRQSGLDPAVSYDMTVDHAFSQTLTRVLGGLDRYPTIPVFINCVTEPFVPFRRTRLLGEAIGRFAAMLGRRVLFLASGGMSHHPTRYYPDFGSGEDRITAWQLSGGSRPESLNEAEWLERLEVMHHEGAQMIVDGVRTPTQMRLNPEIDKRFLDVLTGDELHMIDEWDQHEVVEEGGIGFMELQTWIAAAAAYRTGVGGRPVVDFYGVTEELGIATGIVHGD